MIRLEDTLTVEAARAGIEAMPEGEAQSLIGRVARTFGIDDDRRWWWESLPGARVIDYTQDALRREFEGCLRAMRADKVFLVVTNNQFPPWSVFVGQRAAVEAFLAECPWFECFVVDPELKSIVFDTHMSQLVVGGDAASDAKG